MENEPNWANVLRALYNRGSHLHDWVEPTGFGSIRKEDVGSKEYKKYIEWHKNLADKQYEYLREETDLDYDEVNTAIEWLSKHEILSKKEPLTDESFDYEEYCPVELNQNGFNLAREQAMLHRQERREEQRTKRQNDVNRAIGLLTFGLLFATFADTALSVYLDSNFPAWAITFGLSIEAVVIISVSFLLYRNGLLKFDSAE